MAERAGVRHSFSRAAERYDASARLQREVGDRLLGMVPAMVAHRVLDLGCGTGFAAAGLRARFPGATLFSADFSPAMLAAHTPAVPDLRLCADAHALPLVGGGFDLVFSNLMLQWCDLPRALSECRRVLRPGGTLCFSTVLSGTLAEIDAAFARVDRHRHTLAFVDEAALAHALTAAGYRMQRVERQRRVDYFPDARSLLQSNRDIGASRVPAGGRRSVLGRAAWQTVCAALEAMRAPEGIPLSYELAWVVADGPRSGPQNGAQA